MYIFKNALRSVSRSKGRNILIGIIILVIAVSSCVALSIREAAEKAREDSLEDLEVTAQISVDRQSMMSGQQDRESMKEALSNMQELSLSDMETYADSQYVKSFYYTASASLNGDDAIEPVDTTGVTEDTASDSGSTDSEDSAATGDSQSQEAGATAGMQGMQQEGAMGGGGMGGRMGVQGDFTITGYSSDAAMTAFVNGTESITDGSMFEENDTTNQCIISQDLATYNDLAVGDTMTLVNPNKEEETYTFTITGIYENAQTEDSASSMMGGFSASFDSANQIYTSYDNLQAIAESSKANADTTTDETTGMETTTALQSQTAGTYTFASVDDYEAFKEATEASLGDGYTVSSSDVTQYEQSLLPLENLSKYAGYFLIIILAIGGIILIVLNIFNIRERKYEIGVLAAIGMKKGKIALQFIIELLCVTFAAIIIGAAAGAAASIPVTNALLAQQIESSTAAKEEQSQNFGRDMGGGPGAMPGGTTDSGQTESAPEAATEDGTVTGAAQPAGEMTAGPGSAAANYISQVSSATDITVLAELIGIGILLTIISGCVAIVFILRYDPLRILSSRD